VFGPEDDEKLWPLLPQFLLNLRNVLELCNDCLQFIFGVLFIGELASSEPYDELHEVPLGEELAGTCEQAIQIMPISPEAEPQHLDLRLLRVHALFAFFLPQLIEVLSKVPNFHDGWLRLGRNLNDIQFLLTCLLERLRQGNDPRSNAPDEEDAL
jgi:hypothetical protein